MLPILASVASSLASKNKKDSKEESKEDNKQKSGKSLANRIFNKTDSDKNKPNDGIDGGSKTSIIKAPSIKLKKITPESFKSTSILDDNQTTLSRNKSSLVSILRSIRRVLIEIKNIIKKSISFRKNLIGRELISSKKGEFEERERKLESKPNWFSKVGEALSRVEIPFFDRIKQYFSAILIGSLVLFLVKNVTAIIETIKLFFDTLKKIWQAFEPFVTPIWDGLKWIVSEGVELIAKIVGIPSQEADKNKVMENLSQIMAKIPSLNGVFKSIEDTIKGMGGGGTPPSTSGGGVVITDDSQGLRELGLTQQEWNVYKQGIADVEGARYNQMGGSGGRFAGRYQMGDEAITEAAKILGIPKPSRQDFLNNPELQEKMYLAYTISNFRYMQSLSPEFRRMTREQQLATLPMAQLGIGNLANQLRTGVISRDAFGTPTTKFTAAIEKRRREAGLNSFGKNPSTGSPPTTPTPTPPQTRTPTPAPASGMGSASPSSTQPRTITQPSSKVFGSMGGMQSEDRNVPNQQPEMRQTPKIQPQNVARYTEYENPVGKSTIIPLPLPSRQQPQAIPSAGGGGMPSITISKNQLLNSYYKAQLIGFLYKQG